MKRNANGIPKSRLFYSLDIFHERVNGNKIFEKVLIHSRGCMDESQVALK